MTPSGRPIFGQVGVDAFGNDAGWAGAGLLSVALLWFCRVYLPAKDAQLKQLLDDHAKRDRERFEDFRATLADIQAQVSQRDRDRREDFERALALAVAGRAAPAPESRREGTGE